MSRFPNPQQGRLALFGSPFSQGLNPENRWVKLRELFPWAEFSRLYYGWFTSKSGPPVKSAQVVIGALLIKHKLGLSDRETIAQIQENPYLQYFLGYDEFKDREVFDPSLFVHIRRRIGAELFGEFEQAILEHVGLVASSGESNSDPSDEQDQDGPEGDAMSGQTDSIATTPSSTTPSSAESASLDKLNMTATVQTHKGKLVIDAVVTEQQIKYPTDLELLQDSRKEAERLFDLLYEPKAGDEHKPGKLKPRTYRQVARKAFLSVAKLRKKSKKRLRKAIKQQLSYLKRTLKHIASLLEETPDISFKWTKRDLHIYWVIQHIYAQQLEMYTQKKNSCEDRIVSIYQPWVRPIVTGKAAKKTEFGAKLSVGLIDGIACVHAIRWTNFHEGGDLIDQVKGYKERFGYWPEAVSADTKYGSRANRKWLKDHGIRFSGKALGRPKKNPDEADKALKKLKQQEQNLRSTIEGKFGQGKNAYGLAKIKARKSDTSKSWIAAIFFVMNVYKIARLKAKRELLAPQFCHVIASINPEKLQHFLKKLNLNLREMRSNHNKHRQQKTIAIHQYLTA